MKIVPVSLGARSYKIVIADGLLAQLGSWIKKTGIVTRNALVVSQSEIAVFHQKTAVESLARAGFETAVFTTPVSKSSEASKTEAVFSKLIAALSARDGNHKSICLVALGGGVVGDLTGFAAAVYRRGVPYVQVPTTLTAQVDSAIGGKTGIDLPIGKNLLGCVYQPALVLSDIAVLGTLPERHWCDGLAEVIKYGVIRDPKLFDLLERQPVQKIRHDGALLEKVIALCSRIKAQIVEKDEFDKKRIRMILNFGHTAGHAIEAVSNYSRQYTHGEAVAVGMLVACDLSKRLGILRDAQLPIRLEKMLIKYGLPLFFKGLETKAVLKAMGYDKKSERGVNCFILPLAPGRTVLVRDVPIPMIEQALESRKG